MGQNVFNPHGRPCPFGRVDGDAGEGRWGGGAGGGLGWTLFGLQSEEKLLNKKFEK